MVSSSAGNMVI